MNMIIKFIKSSCQRAENIYSKYITYMKRLTERKKIIKYGQRIIGLPAAHHPKLLESEKQI